MAWADSDEPVHRVAGHGRPAGGPGRAAVQRHDGGAPPVDFRRALVLGMAGRRRLDVHRVHPQPVRHQPGPLSGRHPTRLRKSTC